MLTECIRNEDCCMLDNYYVNEAALRIEHKVPPNPHHTILKTGEQLLHYRTHYCQLFTTKCLCALDH